MSDKTSPLRAIKAKCMDCSGYVYNDVKTCNIPDCPLYPFRLGHNPDRVLSDAQKAALDKARSKSPLCRKSRAETGEKQDNAPQVMKLPAEPPKAAQNVLSTAFAAIYTHRGEHDEKLPDI